MTPPRFEFAQARGSVWAVGVVCEAVSARAVGGLSLGGR
jgi:hypothetical protein